MSRDVQTQIVKYLEDAHAMEEQSIKLCEKGARIAGEVELAQLFHGHLSDSQEHERAVRQRLEALGAHPNPIKDTAQKGAAMALGALMQAMPDTPAKLMAVAFAFESYEIACYTMLRTVAEQAGDQETIALCERIVPVEQQAAELIAQRFGDAAKASLEHVGVAA